MVLKLYGNELSQPTRSVLWFSKLNHIPLEFEMVRLEKGEHKSETFLKMNPNGKIPVLLHRSESLEDFVLFESQAIVHYLRRLHADKVASHWYPEQDLRTIARIDSYLNWHGNHFRPAIAGYVFSAFIGPKTFGKPFTEEQVEKARKNSLDVLQMLNNYWLSDGKYIGGATQPSIADLFCYGEISQLMFIEQWDVKSKQFYNAPFFSQFDHVISWMKKIQQLDEYDTIHNATMKIATKRFGITVNSKL
jgi:glutathione S-transferase